MVNQRTDNAMVENDAGIQPETHEEQPERPIFPRGRIILKPNSFSQLNENINNDSNDIICDKSGSVGN